VGSKTRGRNEEEEERTEAGDAMPRLRPADSLDADGLRPEGAAVLGVRGEAQGWWQVKTDNSQSIAALEALRDATLDLREYCNDAAGRASGRWFTLNDSVRCVTDALATLRATHAAQPEPTQPTREPDAVWTLDRWGHGGTLLAINGDTVDGAMCAILGNRRSVKLHVFVVED